MVTKFNTSTTASLGLSTSDTPTFAGVNLGEDNLTVYDEGTWTPVIKIGSTTITVAGASTSTFTRVGKVVFVSGHLRFNRGTNTGVITCEGLPVTAGSAPVVHVVPVYFQNNFDASPFITSTVVGGATVLEFKVSPHSTSTSHISMSDAHCAASTELNMFVTGFYFV